MAAADEDHEVQGSNWVVEWQLLIGFVVMTLLTWVVIPLLRMLLGW